MNTGAFLQPAVYLLAVLLLARPLGRFIARVYLGSPLSLDRWLGPVERTFYRLAGPHGTEEMGWKSYAIAILTFNFLGFVLLYAIERLQHWLPLDPASLPAVPPDLAFNAAVSFTTNTNWQAYGGETTMSHFTQMAGLAVQNFLSAATGMAVLAALARGLARRTASTIGNFWVDLVRGTLYVLLPLSLILSLALVSQGVVQTLEATVEVPLRDRTLDPSGAEVVTQGIVLGPVASQVAIKQLGTNGGGFFNVNSAHPFENPNAVSCFLELVAILLIPAALCYTFGSMVGDPRQGRALLAAMTIVYVLSFVACYWAEQRGNPRLAALGVDDRPSALQPGGNMEGKEARFGLVASTLWACATTAASNGSVNSMHDSYTPLGGLVPLLLILLGEVIFGGVGSGLYGMIVFVILAVFIAGLMAGQTPEYLGKKIEAFEIQMASVALLAPVLAVLAGTALAAATDSGRAGALNPGPHGFSEILYGFASAGNNNGSAFAGLGANSTFYNVSLALAMLVGRYGVAVPVLALAGSLAGKKPVAPGPGTLSTHTPLFLALLLAILLLVGALTFLPALALGPIAEHLTL